MAAALPDTALDQLFRNARSYNGWLDKDVTDEQIHAIYELAKMGATSANQQPGRIAWCKSPDAKQRLAQYASPANQPKIVTAPVCAIGHGDRTSIFARSPRPEFDTFNRIL